MENEAKQINFTPKKGDIVELLGSIYSVRHARGMSGVLFPMYKDAARHYVADYSGLIYYEQEDAERMKLISRPQA